MMNITEMHTLFRQLSQQMGLQNVRGILPEQIDLLLNTSILDILKQIINTNIGLTNVNGLVNNSKLGQINSLKTLYKKKIFSIEIEDSETGVYKIGSYEENNKQIRFEDLFYVVDASINYSSIIGKKFTTPFFPIRIIEAQYADNVINDPILKPVLKSPIMFDDKIMCENKVNKYDNILIHDKNLRVKQLKIGFISKPIEVKLDGNNSINSDMPEQFHNDIVKHAVELYLSSIGVGQRVETNNRNNQ